MKQTKILNLTLLQLKELYNHELPEIVRLAEKSKQFEEFRTFLSAYVVNNCNLDKELERQLQLLIEFDGRNIKELSTGNFLCVSTLSMLYSFLTGKWTKETGQDLFIDLFHQLSRIKYSKCDFPSEQQIKNLMERWPKGLDQDVQYIRSLNKERIIHVLIQKISFVKRSVSRYYFRNGISYNEKYDLVSEWWNDFQFHLHMAIRTPVELNSYLGNSLSEETMFLLKEAFKKGMPFFATPYYLSLLNCTDHGYDDRTIRSYILFSPQLVQTFGSIRAWEREDIIVDGEPNAAGWFLPNGHNIHRRYPEVAILIPDTMGRACGGLCASCQRMYDFQSKRFNFELEKLSPKEHWETRLKKLMDYFEEDTQLRDILITGGDAFMSQNKTLHKILDSVYQMALRKQKKNVTRHDGEKYAEIQRIRLGTRLPAYLPMRIDDELITILKQFKEKALTIGIRQFIIQTHFQSPLEITPEASEGIRKLLAAGWLITNQLVFNVAASRRGHTARLRQELNHLGVICYYTFSVKGFEENNAVFTPNCRSVQEQQEEKYLGKLSTEDECYLTTLLSNCSNPATEVSDFLQLHQIPFLATDRNVLNLPAIGKSMSFHMIGITIDGKRILQFDHDNTRWHSPIIKQMGQVYIIENKSVASYLRQLQTMGEDVEEYKSIWNYTKGTTEPRFNLFEYPDLNYKKTERITHLRCPSQEISSEIKA